jgi:hypothetical protein
MKKTWIRSAAFLSLFNFIALGCTNTQKPLAKQPNVVTAEASPLTLAEHLYANAGTPKFWGSRICGLVSRAEIDTLFGVDPTPDPVVDTYIDSDARSAEYFGQSSETWSSSHCEWVGFGSVTVFDGAWPNEYEPRRPTELAKKDRPDNAEETCEPEPGVETNGWCERLRVVSINGKDVKLFDSFDDVLPDSPDSDSEVSQPNSVETMYLSVPLAQKQSKRSLATRRTVIRKRLLPSWNF